MVVDSVSEGSSEVVLAKSLHSCDEELVCKFELAQQVGALAVIHVSGELLLDEVDLFPEADSIFQALVELICRHIKLFVNGALVASSVSLFKRRSLKE